ncbi:cupin domain-containing protein [Pseudocnuella soli]|uniref:cupin domain-containing protein n=1 Tax=Pseudocnuella soli TaxID=2502779 RepID=UPI001044BF93|nr:cupin domain-containing protein [Pseudocnuella soli]
MNPISNVTQEVIFISNGAGPRVGIAGGMYQTIISGAQTGGSYAMIHMQVPPGGGPAPHAHPQMQESFYVLEGTVEFITEKGSQLAQKGDFIQIPLNGPVHCFKNKGNENARLLCTVLPAGLEAFFEQAGQPLIDGEPSPAPQMDEAAQQRIAALAKQYGQVLYPPDYFSKR